MLVSAVSQSESAIRIHIPVSPPSCASLPNSLSHPSRPSQSTELISLAALNLKSFSYKDTRLLSAFLTMKIQGQWMRISIVFLWITRLSWLKQPYGFIIWSNRLLSLHYYSNFLEEFTLSSKIGTIKIFLFPTCIWYPKLCHVTKVLECFMQRIIFLCSTSFLMSNVR